VLLQRLLDVPEAIESYREALQEDPASHDALAALMELTLHEEHRMRAAEVIEPLLREGERWDELVVLVERKLSGMSEPGERLEQLIGLAAIHEHGRKDKSSAFEALARALAEQPSEVGLHDDLERLAGELDAFDRFYVVLVERARHNHDPAQAGDLLRRAGRIAEHELHDDARAIESYKLASTHDDDGAETLEALDRLYMKTERWEPLLEVLERRIAAITTPPERAELLLRLGDLREKRFDDGRGAFVAYQEVLDNDASDARALAGMSLLGARDELARDVLDVLERCYREIRAIDKVVELYDLRARLAPSNGEKARLLREAAEIWERELGQPERALASLRRAFELDPEDSAVLDDMERLASAASAWPVLAGLAETLISGNRLDNAAKRELALRGAAWYREFMADPVGEERCLTAVLALAPDELSVHARMLELVRAQGEPRAVLAALRAFATVDDDEQRRVAHLHEAGALALELADPNVASDSFERILESHPEDSVALAALADLRGSQGRHGDAVQFLTRWLAVEVEPQRRLVLHHAISSTLVGPLADSDGAAHAYLALLEEFPSDASALAALEGLYEGAARWSELEQLLAAQLDNAGSLAARIELRLRLSRLHEEQLGHPQQALEQLRAVLDESPDEPRAIQEFERLLSASGSVSERTAWLEQRVDRALDVGDTPHAVAQLWQLAALCESAGPAAGSSEAVLLRIHEIEPSDVRAIEKLVQLYRSEGNGVAAAGFMELLLPLQPPSAAIATAYALAELAEQQLQSPDLVERALGYALSLDRTRAETRARLRKFLTASGAFDQLAHLLEEEVELLPTPTEQAALLREVAKLRAASLHDAAGAVSLLERAVALVPDDRESLLALCDLYVAAGRSADAIPVLEKIIVSYGGRRAKEVAVYEHRLGHAYEGMGRLDDALKHYDNAFKIDLTSVPVLRDLGRLCMARGDLERAQKTYRALLLQKLGNELGITKSEVYFRLGEISVKQGDKLKAKAMLERAISEGGQHAAAKALLEQL
jgi:tetratricopeptide (TPR) repeat protein